MSGTTIAIAVAAFILFDLLLLAFILRRQSSVKGDRNTLMTAIAQALNAPYEKGHIPLSISGHTGRIYLTRSGRRSPPTQVVLELSAPRQGGGVIRFTTEGRSTEVGRKLGLLTEVTTGDPEFDAFFFIDADRTDFAQTSLADPKLRAAVLGLGKIGFQIIELTQDGCSAKSHFASLDAAKVPSEFPAAMTALAESLERCAANAQAFPAPSAWYKSPLVVASGIAALSVGVLWAIVPVLYPPLDWWEIIYAVAPASVILLVGWIVLSITTSAKKFRAAARAGTLIVCGIFVSVAGPPLVTALVNGYLDDDAGSTVRVVIVDKHSHRSKKKTTYSLKTAGLRPMEETHTFKVTYDLYSQATPGASQLAVHLRPGALGYSWIAGMEVVGGG